MLVLRTSVLSLAVLAAGAALAAQGVDLAARYPATIDRDPDHPQTRPWTCGPEDVWALRAFDYGRGQKLRVALKKGQVAFGVHQGNVMWAAVFPDKPGELRSSLAGDREKVVSVFLRFHPARVGELFPRKTVRGQGQPGVVGLAKRVCAHKINAGWQANNLPVVPVKSSIVLDVQTEEGARRYFAVDTDKGTVEYVKFFEDRALKPLTPTTRKASLEAFDAVFETFDREYAMFGRHPELDWDKVGKTFRKQAAVARTTYDTGAAIAGLLAHLEDLHVWVKAGDDFVPCYTRHRPLNASWRAIERRLGKLEKANNEIHWGRTEDGIGYVNIHALNDRGSEQAFDAVLERLADTWALVLDLRFNGGGGEDIARLHAGRFLAEPRVYSCNRYRAGPRHDQLGPLLQRTCEPRGPWRYASPVVTLIGRKTMSSAESFALMMAQCASATTMGAPTAGSSGNPRRLELPGAIVVNMPRWIDMDPEGNLIEGVGVPPRIPIEAAEDAFTDAEDPVLDAALRHLREQPRAERRPGKRGG